jgi:hypothetical protein
LPCGRETSGIAGRLWRGIGSTGPIDTHPGTWSSDVFTSTLHYLKRGTERPASYRIEPPGVPRWNGTDDPHAVTIEDARGREAEFTLDRSGFALVKAPTGQRFLLVRRDQTRLLPGS